MIEEHEVTEWVAFCEESTDYSSGQFSALFMELFWDELTDQDEKRLRTIFGAVPNSVSALEKMLQLNEFVESKTDDELVFDLYSVGADYAIGESEILIVNYRGRDFRPEPRS